MGQQPTAGVTTRDVLQQIGRRLTLIEDDVRKLHETLDAKIDSVEQRLSARIVEVEQCLSARIVEVEQRLSARIDDLEQRVWARMDSLEQRLDTKIDGKVDSLRVEMNRRLYWMIGLLFASWLSTMGTTLTILLRM